MIEIHAASRFRDRCRSSCNWISRCGTCASRSRYAVSQSCCVVQPKLLRLRLFGRSDRILEWNLCDRHALGLTAKHLSCIRLSLDTEYTRGVASGLRRK